MKIEHTERPKNAKLTIYFSAEPEGDVPAAWEDTIRLAAERTLQYERFPYDAELSVTLCHGPYIRELNAAYRDKDAETDVLSFPLFDSEEEDDVAEDVVPLGDVVLNTDRAREQAAELGHSFLREAAFLTVHSVLHLLGYDHERSPEEDEDMCRRQREIIASIEDMIHKTEENA